MSYIYFCSNQKFYVKSMWSMCLFGKYVKLGSLFLSKINKLNYKLFT